MAKIMRIKMTDKDTGAVCFWTVRSHKAFCVDQFQRKAHYETGWLYQSEDGCERFVEGAWRELVPAFHLTAENYGYHCNLS